VKYGGRILEFHPEAKLVSGGMGAAVSTPVRLTTGRWNFCKAKLQPLIRHGRRIKGKLISQTCGH
jgi:hypothetical protein